MQFANDITPLTTHSTAKLRRLIANPFANDAMRDRMQMEIDSREEEQLEIRFSERELIHPNRYELSRPFVYSDKW